MKSLIIVFTLLAFAFSAPFALAQDIKCCVKGDCKDMTKAECKKAGGKVVKSCDKCKPPAKKTPAKQPKKTDS